MKNAKNRSRPEREIQIGFIEAFLNLLTSVTYSKRVITTMMAKKPANQNGPEMTHNTTSVTNNTPVSDLFNSSTTIF